jgi:hypothetical protein
MGNSGGSWFENVCNSHPKVRAWEELTRLLGNSPPINEKEPGRSQKISKITISFLQEQLDKKQYDSIGLIKSFTNETVNFCLKNNGRIVQMFRNPIKVLNSKMYSKKAECIIRNVIKDINTKEKEFEAHVEFYSSLYKLFFNRSSTYLTIKLEDINKSISEGSFYFKEIIQYVTGVNWSDDQIKNVKNSIFPRQKNNFNDNKEEEMIWNSWSAREREIFVKYFSNLMKEFNYRSL